MSADVVLWLIVVGVGLVWLGFWWMNHGPGATSHEEPCRVVLRAEASVVSKVNDRMVHFGEAWEEAFKLLDGASDPTEEE